VIVQISVIGANGRTGGCVQPTGTLFALKHLHQSIETEAASRERRDRERRRAAHRRAAPNKQLSVASRGKVLYNIFQNPYMYAGLICTDNSGLNVLRNDPHSFKITNMSMFGPVCRIRPVCPSNQRSTDPARATRADVEARSKRVGPWGP
jgi:hypothetical protein